MKIILFYFLTIGILFCGENPRKSFFYELKNYKDTIVNVPKFENPQKVKPLKAALYSAIVPGSGEYLTENTFESILFFTVEVAAITSWIVFQNKGDEQTKLYKNYADENWSVVKYSEWLNKNGSKYGDPVAISINPNSNLKPWERVSWEEINKWESSSHTIGFTHVLPQFGSQQYYELIGKYLQYKYGWSTYQFNGDPLGDDSYSEDVPQQVKDYMAMRGKANKYFDSATLASRIVFVNHILSALNAALQAKIYNQKIETEVKLNFDNYSGKLKPEIFLTINF
ncbi:MAG: hypothetical protein O3A55_04885 [Bacteroidetes bacterium]|nr:hypothetical protein [Bacteroidota bacterium]